MVLEPLEALPERRERVAVGLVLLLEPARADAVEGAAAGDDVDRGRDLGVLRRVAVRHAAHEQAEGDGLRPRGEAGVVQPSNIQFCGGPTGGIWW